MEEILTVVFVGLIVVFSVLLLLTALIWLFGKIFGLFTGKKSADGDPGGKTGEPAKTNTAQPPAVKQFNTAQPAEPADGLSDEVLAVISAAVYSYSESTGTAYRIKGVRRVSSGRPAWAFAGIWDSTRPF